MIEQAKDIVAILCENGVRTRRERAAFVAKLKDEMGLTFVEIAKQINVSPQRAQQLYTLSKFFQRSAHSPFAHLSTRARNFLNNVAHHVGLPQDWEQNPLLIARLVKSLTMMDRHEAMKFRNLGKATMTEVENFMREHNFGFMADIPEALETADEPKEFTSPSDPEEVKETLADFLNRKGFRGQFKIWPTGTHKSSSAMWNDPAYAFTLSVSDFMADAWEERWEAMQEFEILIRRMGYEYDAEGEPGETRVFHFFPLTGD